MDDTTRTPTPHTRMFRDRDSAEAAYHDLKQRGYRDEDISVVMTDETHKRYYPQGKQTEMGNKAAEGAGVGGAIGGTLGAIAGAVAAAGTSLAIPGLGLVIAGPLAAALAGGGAGAATGGLLGALAGWRIPEERVKHYESELKEGGILIGVNPRTEHDARYFESEWHDNRI